MEEVTAWFAGRLPDDWFTGPIEVVQDRDEILVTGTLPAPELDDDATETDRKAAATARIQGFREDTRTHRIKVASEAEAGFGRKVSWGASCGPVSMVFTHLSVPAMTRLRIRERKVLDTLVETGVAKSRSDALAWCVRLVARNEDEWLKNLRDALVAVEDVREQGPQI